MCEETVRNQVVVAVHNEHLEIMVLRQRLSNSCRTLAFFSVMKRRYRCYLMIIARLLLRSAGRFPPWTWAVAMSAAPFSRWRQRYSAGGNDVNAH
jgi:hypothetical protein